MTDIVCLGEPMVEFNQSADGRFVQGIGGDTSNCAISAARQGASVAYFTRLGRDPFGDQILKLWRAEGVDASTVVRDPHAPTGIYFVTHDDDGHHFSYYRKHSAASLMRPEELPVEQLAGARFLHVSAISQAISQSATDTVFAALELARSQGVTVSYDTNLRLNMWPESRARAVSHEAMRYCQLALPSYDDAVVLTSLKAPDDIVDFYLHLGAKMVVLKMGRQGAIAATDSQRKQIEPVKVRSIDANAAGDTFAGALLAELARGEDVFSAATYANCAAALSTTTAGAVASIPGRKQVEEMVLPATQSEENVLRR